MEEMNVPRAFALVADVLDLKESLGDTCNMSIRVTKETEETGQVDDGFKHYRIIPHSEKMVITITPRKE